MGINIACVTVAAAATPALPAEGTQMVFTPDCRSMDMAIDIPLSLNEPVGFIVSFFRQYRTPLYVSGVVSGVQPSPRLVIYSGSTGGRKFR